MADGQTANPAPLGLAGFGLTTVVLSCMNAGLFPAEAASVVVPLAFSYGGLAQMVAGVLEYRNGNTFATVAFISYGTFWWWYALLLWCGRSLRWAGKLLVAARVAVMERYNSRP
jgi:uncharacterized protein